MNTITLVVIRDRQQHEAVLNECFEDTLKCSV